MGLFKPDAPKPPDYGPLIKASAAAATQSAALAKEQFAWAKDAYASDKAVSDKVTASFLDSMETAKANSLKDRQRYETTFQPLEDSLVKDAQDYNSPERKAQEMGRAQAGVAQQFEAKRQASTRELESYGINPASTRFAALDMGLRAEQGAAEAAAADRASRDVDAKGMALRSDAINVGNKLPTQSMAYTSQQGALGSGAVGADATTTGTGASTMGTALGWNGASNSAIGQQGNLMAQDYKNRYDYSQTPTGVGALLGYVAGNATKALSFFGGGGSTLSSAGAGLYSEGGAVKTKQSPSAGAIPDDVPARLSAGEFVIPKDVVAWKGEEFFHKLNMSAREKRGETSPPRREMGAIPHPATFVSRSHNNAGALPQR